MIVNYEWKNGKLLVSYIDSKGNIKFKNYPFANPKDWTVTTENDPMKSKTLRTWDKKPVKLQTSRNPTRYTIYEYFHALPESEQSDIFAYNDPKITFCDIEVEITTGFPEAHLAANKVTAVSLIHKNKIILMGIKSLKESQIRKMERDINDYFKEFNTNYKIQWHFYDEERDMLYDLFNEIIPTLPVITGWNFIKYDWVYLVTRARHLKINPDVASPTGKLVKPWRRPDPDPKKFKPIFEELPEHRVIVDYMDLYKKWDTSVKIKESDKLDYVAGQMLGVKKLEYEGSLKDLFHNNYYDYMLYCCIDTALVQLIHEKSRIFDIMTSISNIANIEITQAVSALRVTEGILFKDYYDNGIIMCRKAFTPSYQSTDDESESEAISEDILSGGYVKFPSIGIFLWVSVFDFSSLYPTTMRQYNIGPDTFKGMKLNDKETILNGVRSALKSDDIILNNGAVFINEEGITTKKLTATFKDRKTNKNIGLDYKKQEVLLKKYLQVRNGK